MSEPDQQVERRPPVAAALAAAVPGFGHAYARAWVRALLWATMFVAALWLLSSGELFTTVPSTSTPAQLYSESPDMALFTVAVWGMNVVDAYLTTSRLNARAQQGAQCPHCGKELDGDLDFCHWCTTPLDGAEVDTDDG